MNLRYPGPGQLDENGDLMPGLVPGTLFFRPGRDAGYSPGVGLGSGSTSEFVMDGMPMARILVVDDEPLIAMLLEDWLVELGYKPLGPVSSVTDALALIEQADRPDGAILDVALGTESSYPVADALTSRGIPVVFATGHSGESLPARFTGAPTLAKPFDFETLKRAVHEMSQRVCQS
jgi:CheY-like chemotaxis protein